MRRALACLGFAFGVLVVSAVTAPGCGSYGGTAYPEGGVAGPKGGGVGASCSTPGRLPARARRAPATSARRCQCGPFSTGTACIINDECATGQYCGPDKTCIAGGTGAAGTSCHTDADCAVGLRCDVVGLGAECKPEGTGDLGASCNTSADCFGGLACTMGTCQSVPPGEPPFGVPIGPGRAPPAPDHGCGADVQAYFRVPRGTADDGDFYRLPFPNDVRKDGAKISLTGHPTPGPGLIGVDLVAEYISDLEATVDGFSTYPTVFLRFSAPGRHLRHAQGVGRRPIHRHHRPADAGRSGARLDRHDGSQRLHLQ